MGSHRVDHRRALERTSGLYFRGPSLRVQSNLLGAATFAVVGESLLYFSQKAQSKPIGWSVLLKFATGGGGPGADEVGGAYSLAVRSAGFRFSYIGSIARRIKIEI